MNMRRVVNLNEGWGFQKKGDASPISVDLPHTWNDQDKGSYLRATCIYSRKLIIDPAWVGKVLTLEFLGANSSCEVYFNEERVAHHDGGYSAFRVELPKGCIQKENLIRVEVSNEPNPAVYPQKADFTFYGGIYRDVNLLITEETRFDRVKDGVIGAKIDAYAENGKGIVDVEPYIIGEGEVTVSLYDGDGLVATSSGRIEIDNPHLWNGVKDPYLYILRIELSSRGQVVDEIEKKIGFRAYRVDSKKGFFLNGASYPLRGVSRHQDREGLGNALKKEHHEEDARLIKEIGASCVRLAHYQHDEYFLSLCDELGLVVWAEIPYISVHEEAGNENLKQQLMELIAQQRHHPCICFWGISNEITMFKGHQKELLKENSYLNDLCHELDPHRLTTMACFAMCSPFNKVASITDAVAWNLYFGWYTPFLWLYPLWFSFYRLFHPSHAVGLSEYGAEAMLRLHSNHPHRGDSSEEYQLKYHAYCLKFIEKHPYLWGTYVWNMFDFGSAGRNHGGDPGVNHKGLIAFDHQTKKDSFYLYKAHWSDAPFVHIAGKRFKNRNGKKTKIEILTNEDGVALEVNGKAFRTLKGGRHYIVFVPLPSDISISVTGKSGTSDAADFHKVEKYDESYRLHEKSDNRSWEK